MYLFLSMYKYIYSHVFALGALLWVVAAHAVHLHEQLRFHTARGLNKKGNGNKNWSLCSLDDPSSERCLVCLSISPSPSRSSLSLS